MFDSGKIDVFNGQAVDSCPFSVFRAVSGLIFLTSRGNELTCCSMGAVRFGVIPFRRGVRRVGKVGILGSGRLTILSSGNLCLYHFPRLTVRGCSFSLPKHSSTTIEGICRSSGKFL